MTEEELRQQIRDMKARIERAEQTLEQKRKRIELLNSEPELTAKLDAMRSEEPTK